MAALPQPPPIPVVCPQCGTQVAPGFLVCPSCRHLVHSEQLKQLAQEAEQAEKEGRLSDALERWRLCLERLPAESRQYQTISARAEALGKRVGSSPGGAGGARPGAASPGRKLPKWLWWLGPLAPVALLALKFKTLLILLLTKAKFLLLGLTEAGTFFSMILAFGVYWAAWGWRFALGLVLSIYVHEMGHVAALRRLGIRATAPMFIPGLGAMVLLKQRVDSARDDARVGLAGPIWGIGAALFCYAVFAFTGEGIWGALARLGGWITLFNLIPVWQLDGGRGFHAMSRLQRWLAVGVLAGMWMVAKDGLFLLVILGAVYRAFTTEKGENAVSDWPTFVRYAWLVIISGYLCAIHVPMPGLE